MLQNTELKTILTQKGYQFNEQGNLLLDDMANKTTSLDLSGTGISVDALSELSILPNLTDVDLSDNGYTKSFDFTKLPPQITGVDLTGNELYEYPGLLSIVTQENGDEDVTVLRTLTKLYLPESAKYNCNEIPTYFAKVSGVDMKMANASGTLETYTTLREVPDAGVLELLKGSFPSMFNGDKIDISRRLVKADEKASNIVILSYLLTDKTQQITSVEGVEYIAMNKGFEGTLISLEASEEAEAVKLPYLKLGKNVSTLIMYNIGTPNLDLTEAVNICSTQIFNNPDLETFDISNAQLFGQRSKSEELATFDNPSELYFVNCDKLKDLIMPTGTKIIATVELCNLPKLETLDFSGLSLISTLVMGNLPSCEITYLDYKEWNNLGTANFGITEDVYNKKSTQDFLDKYHNDINQFTAFPQESGLKAYRWKKLYK